MRPILPAALLAATLPVATVAADEPKADAVECLAEAVYYEARGTSETAQAAVAHVVLNRADSEDFPDTACGVVADGCEFSYMCDGRPERMAEPDDREEAFETAEKVVEGEVPDPTRGALFFHAESAAQTAWFATREPSAEIGGHLFYR